MQRLSKNVSGTEFIFLVLAGCGHECDSSPGRPKAELGKDPLLFVSKHLATPKNACQNLTIRGNVICKTSNHAKCDANN